MLGLGYAYRGGAGVLSAWSGLKFARTPVVLDIPGIWLARLAGETPRRYYSSPSGQLDIRRAAGKILDEAAGIKLTRCVDFGGLVAGSVFGCEPVFGDDAPPYSMPALSSPEEVPQLAARVDALSMEEAGLVPRLFEWRHWLRQHEDTRLGYALRIPGIATLAEQVCGSSNLYRWIESRPAKMADLAGVLRRTVIRLVQFIRRRTGTPIPIIVIEDPAMAKVDAEAFHEIFWRATRTVAMALTSSSIFRCYRAPGTEYAHAVFVARLAPRVMQIGEVDYTEIRSIAGRKVVWGGLSETTLAEASPEEVADTARKAAKNAAEAGMPLMLSPRGAVPKNTPLENIVALAKYDVCK